MHQVKEQEEAMDCTCFASWWPLHLPLLACLGPQRAPLRHNMHSTRTCLLLLGELLSANLGHVQPLNGKTEPTEIGRIWGQNVKTILWNLPNGRVGGWLVVMGGMGDSGPTVFDPPRAILGGAKGDCHPTLHWRQTQKHKQLWTQNMIYLNYTNRFKKISKRYVKLGMANANMTIPRSYNPLPLSFFSRLTRQGEQLHFRNNRKQEGVAVSHTHILERCLNMWSRVMRVWMGAMCNRYIQS